MQAVTGDTSLIRGTAIRDSKSLDVLLRLGDDVPYKAYFLTDDTVVISWFQGQAEVYHRRRPEYWWGVAWLPEFWLTVVLDVGLVFSLRSDSRIMRA